MRLEFVVVVIVIAVQFGGLISSNCRIVDFVVLATPQLRRRLFTAKD